MLFASLWNKVCSLSRRKGRGRDYPSLVIPLIKESLARDELKLLLTQDKAFVLLGGSVYRISERSSPVLVRPDYVLDLVLTDASRRKLWLYREPQSGDPR